MSDVATIYLHDDACWADVVFPNYQEQSFRKDGITEKNIEELVLVVRKAGYRVILYRVTGFSKFYSAFEIGMITSFERK